MLDDETTLFERSRKLRQEYYGNQVTFSKNVFLPVVKLCRDSCAYCGFSRNVKKPWMNVSEAKTILEKGRRLGCSEALIVTGDHPETKYRLMREFLHEHHFHSTPEYTLEFVNLALEQGLLPHVNLGVLSHEEIKLFQYNVASMGLMLETTNKELLEKGKAHHNSPDKNPEKRIETIKTALSLKIPFTSGLLLGIGETWSDRIQSLLVLRSLHKTYGFLQEVILQPFQPIPHTPMEHAKPIAFHDLLKTIAIARIILPKDVSLQVPPNLLDETELSLSLIYGVNDLGGVSPVTIDYVNPNHAWPNLTKLVNKLKKLEYHPYLRLPVYPQYINNLADTVKTVLLEYFSNYLETGVIAW